jgi:peroxiredoxin
VELQQVYPEFLILDAEILGISMDNISETSMLAETLGVTYKLLSDPDGKVVKEYGVYNLHGDEVAAPAVFIIGPDRGVKWRYVGRNIGDRASTDDIIARLK